MSHTRICDLRWAGLSKKQFFGEMCLVVDPRLLPVLQMAGQGLWIGRCKVHALSMAGHPTLEQSEGLFRVVHGGKPSGKVMLPQAVERAAQPFDCRLARRLDLAWG